MTVSPGNVLTEGDVSQHARPSLLLSATMAAQDLVERVEIGGKGEALGDERMGQLRRLRHAQADGAQLLLREKTSRGVPVITSSPRLITTSRVASVEMSSMLWLTMMTVSPPAACSSRIILRMLFRPAGSSPAVGSSRMSTRGCMASTPAMATRRICPPLSSKGERSATAS